MPSYSVSLNAVVSPTGGSIARLDAVCAAGPTSNYVVVATAANLAVAGGRFRGVALEAASGNQAIQIVDFGTVDLLTTVLSGTGEYVSVNATGQLERTASFTSATIGTLENGTVHVNVALSLGGAGNATAIQGVPVSSASAARSWVPRGDGSGIRSAMDSALHAADYSAATDGTTDARTALNSAVTDAGTSSTLFLGPGTYRIASNITFSCAVRFAPGAILKPDSGVVLTFTGGISAGRWQIFSNANNVAGHGRVDLSTADITEAYEQWWGAACDAVTVASNVSLTSGSVNVTGATFAASAVGKPIVFWDRNATAAPHITTIASTTTIAVAPGANIPASGVLGACQYGTDDGDCVNAAIQACAGKVTLLLLGRDFATSKTLLLLPSTGAPIKIDNPRRAVARAVATIAGGVWSTDNGLATNNNQQNVLIRGLRADCGRAADYGILLGKKSFAANMAGVAGVIDDLAGDHANKSGVVYVGCQSTTVGRSTSTYSVDEGIQLIACNQTTFIQTKGTNTLGANKAGIVIDGLSGVGSGGCTLLNPGAEVCTGHGIEVNDTPGTGTAVTIFSPWCEGNSGDGVYLNREGCLLVGGVYSNIGGGTTQYPWRISSTAHGCTVIGAMNVAAYSTPNLGGRVDAGALSYGVRSARNYNTTTNAVFNPSIASGWVSTFTLAAAATTTVNDSRIKATSVIKWVPTNAAASTLLRTQGLYLSARTDVTSFAVTTDTGVAAAGTETFAFICEEPRP